jgi:hypothetical protein
LARKNEQLKNERDMRGFKKVICKLKLGPIWLAKIPASTPFSLS